MHTMRQLSINRITRCILPLALVVLSFSGCDSGTEPPRGVDCQEDPTHPDCGPEDPGLTGTLYYSRASTFTRYDLDTRSETSLLDEGAYYTVSQDASEFAWFEYDPSDHETRVQFHDIQDPASYQTVTLSSVEIETGLSLAPGIDLFGALVPSPDAEFSRTDLLLFNRDGAFIRGFRHVKHYAFAPNENDLVISVELLDEDDEPVGYLVVLIRGYRGESPEFVVIKEFADYDQLPAGLAVSPSSTTVAYASLKHIYTLPLQENAEHHPITTSSHEEWDVHWSPDGEYLIFTFGVVDVTSCDDVVIVPVHTDPNPIRVRENQSGEIIADDAYQPFPLQPISDEDVGAFSCSPGAFWMP